MIGDSIQLKCPRRGSSTYVFVECRVRGPKRKRRLTFTFEFVVFEGDRNRTLTIEHKEMAAGFTRLSELLGQGWRIL